MSTRVFFRVDGDKKIGLGHVSRCLAMAEMIEESFECVFILNKSDEHLINSIKTTFLVISLSCNDFDDEFAELADLITVNDIVVADGYHFDTNYQSRMKDISKRLVFIDDIADRLFDVDVIFNHGDISGILTYKAGSAKVYSGFDYLIVRKEFLDCALKSKRKISKIETVFICMGGADPFNITVKVLNAIKSCNFIKEVIIVLGSVFQDKIGLDLLLRDYPIKYKRVHNASPGELVNLMMRSDLAVTTASTIALEVCCVKAALLCGVIADNQYAIHSQLRNLHCCLSIGDWNTASTSSIKNAIESLNKREVIHDIISNQSKYVDGKSGERIYNIFKDLVN